MHLEDKPNLGLYLLFIPLFTMGPNHLSFYFTLLFINCPQVLSEQTGVLIN